MKSRDVHTLLSERKKPPDEKAPTLRNISRLSQPKPQQREEAKVEKNFPSTRVIDLAEQEKSSEESRWSRAAHNAHHCCVSQRHPAFVHLTELLVHNRPLEPQRVHLWKLQEFLLIARRLERFISDDWGERPRKKRAFSSGSKDLPSQENPKEFWEEYQDSPGKRLFQVPKSSL